jgi:hypothetical protein
MLLNSVDSGVWEHQQDSQLVEKLRPKPRTCKPMAVIYYNLSFKMYIWGVSFHQQVGSSPYPPFFIAKDEDLAVTLTHLHRNRMLTLKGKKKVS